MQNIDKKMWGHEKYDSSENHVFLKARQAAPRPLSGTATPPQVCFTFLFALGTRLNGHDVCFRDLCSQSPMFEYQ